MKVKFLDMDTKKKPLFIAFSSQKGGVGKSTFTTLLASTLHYRMGYNVAVFDADFPQYSLSKMKSRDLTMVMENENLKKQAYRQFTVINKKAYPIIQHKADTVLEAAKDFIQSTAVIPEIIFFDLPGTVNTAGILSALASMHHIFTPITADRLVMESTLIFTQLLQDVVMKKGETSIETINLFWNQVDGRESTPLYMIYEQLIQQLGLSLMDSRIKNSRRFRKESEKDSKNVFRSTLLPPDERLMKVVNLDVFISEFLKIIQL
jgi:cellulose biosynthesis protein BcsQ